MKRFSSYFILIMWSGSVAAQQRELPLSEIIKFVPDKVKGFTQQDETRSKQMRIGTLTYSATEKKFIAVKQSIKVLLFDFTNASIMYQQALRERSQVDAIESDSLIYRYVSRENYRGWESYDRRRGSSQISLGICDRFFLNLTGENVSLDQLNQVVKAMRLEEFPKSR